MPDLFGSQLALGGVLLMLAGGLISALRSAPRYIGGLLRQQFTTTFVLTNGDPHFDRVSLFIQNQGFMKRTRILTILSVYLPTSHTKDGYPDGGQKHKVFLKPGPGLHYFRYRRRLCWLFYSRSEKTDAYNLRHPETYTFTFFSRDPTIVTSFLEDVETYYQEVLDKEGKINIFSQSGASWESVSSIQPRPLDSVILDEGVVDSLVQDVETFQKRQSWYISTGIPYRRGYLLHGTPGSGKTSVIKALAGHLRIPIYYPHLGDKSCTDASLVHLVTSLTPGSILLLEDLDNIFHGRQPANPNIGITFSGLLNALDGICSSENILLFITANHVDKLDPALIRPGRVDFVLPFTSATVYQAETLFSRFYEDAKPYLPLFRTTFQQTTGLSMSHLQQCFLASPTPEDALRNLANLKGAAWLSETSTKTRSKKTRSSSTSRTTRRKTPSIQM